MAPTHKPVLLLALAALAAAAPAPAAAAPVRETRLAHAVPISGPSTFASDHGYLAWVEYVGKGKRRLVVLRPDGSRRSLVVRGDVRVAFLHGVDQRTGREVTRLVSNRNHRHTGVVVKTYRSPATLRRLDTDLPYSSGSTATDAGRSVTAATVQPPRADDGMRPAFTRANCVFTSSGDLPAMPQLTDCWDARVTFNGDVVVANSEIPSRDVDAEKGSSGATALDVFFVTRPNEGWQRLGTWTWSYEGSSGRQAWCASDRGVAVLEGETRTLLDRPVATWTLRWVSADPSQPGWTADVPQLDGTVNHDGGFVKLACRGAEIYATYTPLTSTGALIGKGSQIVRWLPPAGV